MGEYENVQAGGLGPILSTYHCTTQSIYTRMDKRVVEGHLRTVFAVMMHRAGSVDAKPILLWNEGMELFPPPCFKSSTHLLPTFGHTWSSTLLTHWPATQGSPSVLTSGCLWPMFPLNSCCAIPRQLFSPPRFSHERVFLPKLMLMTGLGVHSWTGASVQKPLGFIICLAEFIVHMSNLGYYTHSASGNPRTYDSA